MISSRSALGSKPALIDSELAEPRGFFLRHASLTRTAVLVDAGFFLKRAARIYGRQTPEAAAKQLHRIALDHLNDDRGRRVARLYRIFVYDAPPAVWKGHLPISKQSVDYGNSTVAQWRLEFHQGLRSLRKVALRASIVDDDFRLDLRQKGSTIRSDLHERIDGLKSVCPRPGK